MNESCERINIKKKKHNLIYGGASMKWAIEQIIIWWAELSESG